MRKYTQKKTERLKSRKGKLAIVYNKYKTIAIFAKKNKKITETQLKRIKEELLNLTINNTKIVKFANIKTFLIPSKVFTKKGILVRMGRGKGKIINKGLILKQGQKCFEIVPNTNKNLEGTAKNLLKNFLKKHNYFISIIL